MNTAEKKQVELFNIITNGVVYSPIVEWGEDDDSYGPYVGYEKNEHQMFKDIPELIKTMRDLADSLEKQTVSHSDEEHYLTGWDD